MLKDPYYLTVKALLQKHHPQEVDAYLKFFPKEEEAHLKASAASTTLPKSIFDAIGIIQSIHYSWLLPHLENYPLNIQSLILASLPVSVADNIRSIMKEPPEKVTLSPFASLYFLNLFFSECLKEEVFPKEFLDPSPFNAFLSIAKNDLVKLIDLLGIEDLANDLKKVVDRQVLEHIKKELTEHQKQYLDYSLKRHDIPVLKPESLAFWTHDVRKVTNQIHLKGIARFSSALFGEEKALIWHITHLLDSGRGKEILKMLDSQETKEIPEKTRQQLKYMALNLLKVFSPRPI